MSTNPTKTEKRYQATRVDTPHFQKLVWLPYLSDTDKPNEKGKRAVNEQYERLPLSQQLWEFVDD